MTLAITEKSSESPIKGQNSAILDVNKTFILKKSVLFLTREQVAREGIAVSILNQLCTK